MHQIDMFEDFYGKVHSLRENNIKPSVDECFYWLDSNNLSKSAKELRIRNGQEFVEAETLILGLSAKRSKKKTKSEIDLIIKKYKEVTTKINLSQKQMGDIWEEIKYKDLHLFSSNRLSPDALGFYRPFHFFPHEDWGIYLNADKLLSYYESLRNNLGASSILFQSDILLGYIVFEVFHHEFFHHIVESAATSLEVISSAFGKPSPLYMDYFYSKYANTFGLGNHEHDPLEEALANAYAYNSFSFSSRVNMGYKSILVKKYQDALLKGWNYDPPGYCSAKYYINSKYIYGATQLMGMVLNTSQIDPASSSIVAKNVLLNGHTAYCSKPDIPTYVIGSESALKEFYELIPVPNATYTNLFWHEDLTHLDKFIQEMKKKEKIIRNNKN